MKGYDDVLVFGVPRSGTTLIFNIVREFLPTRHSHNYHPMYEKIIIPYRDFRDCVYSLMRVKFGGFIKSSMAIKRRVTHLRCYESHKPLYLRYDDFHEDFEYLFDKLEEYLDIEINKSRREDLSKKYSKKRMKKLAKNFNSFKEYDNKYLIKGNHVGDVDYKIGFKDIILYYFFRRDLLAYNFNKRRKKESEQNIQVV